MEDMIHHIWINEKMRNQMQLLMLENPEHMKNMAKNMMEQMLDYIISNLILREQMNEMLLEHQDFMDSIRHEN